ncbi:MAG: extracellular solute-binding protein [Candidatus Omnitrophota bacterium]|jgi:ABC-type glycerol-3-phosphate transport system substrate-binding protein
MRGHKTVKMIGYVLFSLIAIHIICLSGCAKKSGEKEILMWLVGSEKQAQKITELGLDFYKETGVKVSCEAISWGEAHSKYLTSVVGEVTPDIGTMGLTWGTEFGSLGAMVDLRKEFPAELEEISKNIFPGLAESIRYKDSVFAVPFDMSEYIMFYRTDLIKSPPKTWKELTSLLSELNSGGKSMIIDWGGLGWIGYCPYLWQSGGDFYSKDGTSAALDTAEAAAAMKFFTDMYKKYQVPLENKPVEQSFKVGDHPIFISGNWKMKSLTDIAPELSGRWAIAPLPAGPTGKRTGFIGGRVMGIFSMSKYKKESWEFIKYLSRADIQVKLYEATLESHDTYLPTNMKTWDIMPMESSFKEPLREQAMDSKGPPSVLGWDDSTRFIDTAIQMIVLKGKDVKSALAEANRELNGRKKH